MTQTAIYAGYPIRGYAIPEQNRYAASGTIARGLRVVEASRVLGYFTAEQDAQVAGLEWAKEWIDARNRG
ncbi:hypothetical protein [Paraburkholderia humisilvae]|uniref:Uncharacterized protein n=1 Tax=Paraburkholderia humisilvae TaxID=627669 RepID=A0A6J5FAY8_9BURK|nr:hypothetical protein [Paraburkholderia humisilvae]CAB3774627.1 hypothetical protein LMG29542_08005 [Paraburkholderia humisilvae]